MSSGADGNVATRPGAGMTTMMIDAVDAGEVPPALPALDLPARGGQDQQQDETGSGQSHCEQSRTVQAGP